MGLKVEYGEPEELAVDKGTFKGVTITEHAELITKYSEGSSGMTAMSKELGISSRTIMQHIHSHNSAIERSGFCPDCKKASSPLQNKKAERNKLEVNV